MKSNTARKNRFRKNKQVRRARLRDQAVYTAKVLLGALALVTASVAFIFAYDCFTQSRQFQVRRIEVSGQDRLSRQQVLAIAGVGPQTNILALNLTTTRKRLLAEPWIADATVSREIPSGLRIHIREEEPLALLEMDDGRNFLINTAGRVFKREADASAGALPRVQGLSYTDLPVAGRPAGQAFTAVMILFQLARESGSPLPLADIRRLRMDRDIGATVYTGEDDRRVELGFGSYREKIDALGHLMARLKADPRLTRCRVIDLFDVNRIVITPAASGASASEHEEV
jgi:cell division septal protein FtsQ